MLYKNIVNKCLTPVIGSICSRWMSLSRKEFRKDMSFHEAADCFPDRNKLYAYMHHYYSQVAPAILRDHRVYFKNNRRGFGEDAFHAMWYLLLREYRPHMCLEIGVYRGQVISLWKIISKLLKFPCAVYGISPFTPAGDDVSIYLDNIDYMQDTINNHNAFGLPQPELLKALSTDEKALSFIGSHSWNLIYIDGSHDYEVALADYLVCRDKLADGGLLIMDDSSLYTDYRPPVFAFAGHPGPSKVMQDMAMKEMIYLGAVGHNNIFMKVCA